MAIVYKSGQVIGNYQIIRLMPGTGIMSHAYEAVRQDTGEKVFLKCCKSPTCMVPWFNAFVNHQAELRRRIESDVAVRERCYRFIETFTKEGYLYLVFEFIEGGMDLRECIENRDNFSWAQIVTFAKVMMFGIKGLAKVGIIHTDLKPENIYLIPDPDIAMGYRLRIIDLDWAIFHDKTAPWHGERGYVGTPGYLSPEHLRGDVPLSASDVFTCGLILGELLGDGHPYAHCKDDLDAYNESKFNPIKLRQEIPGANRSFVETILNSCLDPDPKKRPTAADVADALTGKEFDWRGTNSKFSSRTPIEPREGAKISSDRRIAVFWNEQKITVVGIPSELGRNHFKNIAHEDVRFLSRPQFRLFIKDDVWMIEHIPQAVNKTLADGKSFDEPIPVYDGMEISVGNPDKGVKKIPLIFRSHP